LSHRGGLGVGRKRLRKGGVDYCVCPKCGYRTRHKRGVPCVKMKCPRCGSALVGAW